MQLEILERHQAKNINQQEWLDLAEHAIEKNPFYEYWSLLPALKWLETQANIKIITIRKKNKLVALFPIKIIGQLPLIRILSFWKHEHCFLTTPLISSSICWEDIFQQLQNRLRTSVIYVNSHNLNFSIERFPFYCRVFFRPSVSHPRSWEMYEASLPSKRKKEYRRICKRLFNQGEINFSANLTENLHVIMDNFIELEASGWKGISGDALAKNPSQLHYYFDLIKKAKSLKKVHFNQIQLNNQPIAISFGFKTGDYFFEIKTAYSESYRALYPGVVLELKNLANYNKHNYIEVDSCTNPDNFVISRMWPDQKIIMNSWIFRNLMLQIGFRLCYPVLRHLKKLAQHLFSRQTNTIGPKK